VLRTWFWLCFVWSTLMLNGIGYDMILQLGWHPVAVIQYTFTHKQYTEQHNGHKRYTEKHNSIRKSADRAPSLRCILWHLPYNWGKSTEKSQYISDIHIVTNDTEAFISLSNQGLYYSRTLGLENMRKCLYFGKQELS
jgi:hypothetical protein